MNILKLLCLLIFGLFICCSQTVESQQIKQNPKPEIQNQTNKSPVLIELFTSEGWSSCPPADRELADLSQKQPYPKLELITLEFHVDYWNNLGWKDEYSQDIFTQRQQIYGNLFDSGTIYTPQMVIDGRIGFTGSNKAKIIRDIPKAIDNPKGKIELNLDKDNKLKINLRDLPNHDQSSVFVAIAEDNIMTDVKRGENAGQKLEHTSVVRELKSIESLSPKENTKELETQIVLQTNWKRENLKIVVFVQENRMRKIHAVGQIRM